MDLREHLKAKSGDQLRDALPLEHFANDPQLRFFLEILLLIKMTEYLPKNEKDEFLACVMTKKDEAEAGNPRKLVMALSLTALKEFDIRQQMYVIAHEAGHILLTHNVGDNNRFDDPKIWNIAIDAMINSLLNKYYGGAVQMPQRNGSTVGISVEGLKAEGHIETSKNVDELTADEVYQLIVDKAEKKGKGKGKGKGGSGQGKGGSGQGQPGDGEGEEGDSDIDKLDARRIDDHDMSLNPNNMDDEVKQVIGQMIKAAQNQQYGSVTGAFVRALQNIVKKTFPFKEVLDPMIFRKHMRFDRPSRRIHIKGMKTFIPRKKTEEFKIYVGIDCSGSCDQYIEGFLGYVMGLPQFEYVVYCDTEIKHIVKKGESIPRFVPGLGGTDLNPMLRMFEEEERKGSRVKCNFVLLTDGEIPTVTNGPKDSTMVVFTTNQLVEFAEARKPWCNIQINPDTCEVEAK